MSDSLDAFEVRLEARVETLAAREQEIGVLETEIRDNVMILNQQQYAGVPAAARLTRGLRRIEARVYRPGSVIPQRRGVGDGCP